MTVGEDRYGRGSVQNLMKMESNTSALKLTTSSYWRPSGKNIHRGPSDTDADDWGVLPDTDLAVPLDDKQYEAYTKYRDDRDLAPPSQPSDSTAEAPFMDLPLQKAVECLAAEIKAE